MLVLKGVNAIEGGMTDKEFTEKMQAIANGEFQPELQHDCADDLIIEYLKAKGLDEAVAAYESIHRLFG